VFRRELHEKRQPRRKAGLLRSALNAGSVAVGIKDVSGDLCITKFPGHHKFQTLEVIRAVTNSVT